LARLSRSTIVSDIDSIGAFPVIELEDKDKAKMAFATPWGSYQFGYPLGELPVCKNAPWLAGLVLMHVWYTWSWRATPTLRPLPTLMTPLFTPRIWLDTS
jgi:hypothetical protein